MGVILTKPYPIAVWKKSPEEFAEYLLQHSNVAFRYPHSWMEFPSPRMNLYLYEYERLLNVDNPYKSVKKLLSIQADNMHEAANKGEQQARKLYPNTFIGTKECVLRYRIPGIPVENIL